MTRVAKKFDECGRELPDPRPMEIPAGMKRPESMQELVRRLVRNQVSQYAQEQGAETFQEANDFEIDDEEKFHSPYEEIEMAPEVPRERVSSDERGERGAGRAVRSGKDGDPDAGERRPKRGGHQVDAFDAQSGSGEGRSPQGEERGGVPRGGGVSRPGKAGKTVKR